jgi:Uncharacterized conserved protein
MAYSLSTAAEVYRHALQENVKRFALLYVSEGVLLAVIGLLAIIYSLATSSGLAVPLGWLLIIVAVLQAVLFFGMRSLPHVGFQLICVPVTLLIGFLLLRDPLQARQTLVLLAVVFLMLQGVSRLTFALSIRPFPRWEGLMASGVLGIVLAFVLVGSLPDPANWLVGLLVGIELVAEGSALTVLAWRRDGPAEEDG